MWCKEDTFIVLSSTAFHSFIHSFIHSFEGNKHIWDWALQWRGGCDVKQCMICLRCFIRLSFDRLFIDYILCFHLFIYFLKIIFSKPERKKETGSKVSAIKRYLILMHCFHADKLSFTCSSGSWDPKNASWQNISSGKSSTRS